MSEIYNNFIFIITRGKTKAHAVCAVSFIINFFILLASKAVTFPLLSQISAYYKAIDKVVDITFRNSGLVWFPTLELLIHVKVDEKWDEVI